MFWLRTYVLRTVLGSTPWAEGVVIVGRTEPASSTPEDARWAVPGVGPGQVDLRARAQTLTEDFVNGGSADPAAQLQEMRRLIDQLEAAWLGAAAQFAKSGGAQDDGSPTLAAWMRHRCNIAPAEASSRARVAEAITFGELQTTSRAMHSGPHLVAARLGD